MKKDIGRICSQLNYNKSIKNNSDAHKRLINNLALRLTFFLLILGRKT